MGTKSQMASDDTCAIRLSEVRDVYSSHRVFVHRMLFSRSVDGEVKLFDIRSSDRAANTWELFPQGLSAFDVHDLTGVFAALVNSVDHYYACTDARLSRTSSVTSANWRTQRTAVYSLSSHHNQALSTLSTVLTVPPPRDALSPFIIRSSSLTFHPREMVYAVGSLDGSGMCPFAATRDCELIPTRFSACYGLQASVLIEGHLKIVAIFAYIVVMLSHLSRRYFLLSLFLTIE